MNKKDLFRKALTEPRWTMMLLLGKFHFLFSDEVYLKLRWRLKMGSKLHLDNPQLFNEKLQWLKLHDRRPEYSIMADKVRVKEYVAKIIGEEHIIPTLGVWDRVEDIELEKLPNQFVLKCNHDSGGLFICKDKSKLTKEDWNNAIQKMIDASAAERCGTADEIAEAGAFLLGEHAGFITGTDLLIDGGVIAAIRTGAYKLHG